MNKTLIIIRGVPGSGKSTLANSIMNECKKLGMTAGHYEADMHFMKNGVYQFNGSELPIAHKECFDNACLSMQENDVTIVSNTFVFTKHMKDYIKYACSLNLRVVVIRCMTDDKVDWCNVHNVPEDVLAHMRNDIEPFGNELEVINGKFNMSMLMGSMN